MLWKGNYLAGYILPCEQRPLPDETPGTFAPLLNIQNIYAALNFLLHLSLDISAQGYCFPELQVFISNSLNHICLPFLVKVSTCFRYNSTDHPSAITFNLDLKNVF